MYQYEIIGDEHCFEEFIKDLFNAKYNTQSFQLYKTKGASQHGIDVFSTEQRIVVQCKKKDISRTDNVLKQELIHDFNKSLQLIQHLPFSFDTFILASTTKRYGNVQEHAAQLSQTHAFEVQFLSWTSIQKLIHKYKHIRAQYYSHLCEASSSDSSGKVVNLAQYIRNSQIQGNVTQVAGNVTVTTKKVVIQRLPSPDSIGGNPLLKQTINSKIKQLGDERKKRFGKSAYPVMINNFKKHFGIAKNEKWTQIWDWPEGCAEAIIAYLEEKYHNTITGRIEHAAKAPGYFHTRGHLFRQENELLRHFGLETKSPEVKELLQRYFSVSTHKDLTDLQHWQLICYLEKEVEKMYEKYDK